MKKKNQQQEAQCTFGMVGNEERAEERVAKSDVRVVCCRQAAPDCLRETLIILNHLMTKHTSVVCVCVLCLGPRSFTSLAHRAFHELLFVQYARRVAFKWHQKRRARNEQH